MELLEKIKEAGVIGAGGAGFPTHAKLNAKADYILLNGAECEPLLRVDQQIMVVYAEEILRGLMMAGECCGAGKAIVGIKGKHADVIEVLERTIQALGYQDRMEIGILPDIYPAGDEQVLVYELTGRIVPETGIPIAVGCVVINAETALNVYNASKGIPVTRKFVTITGEVPRPVTVNVPVGTPLRIVMAMAGLADLDGLAVIDGGPMMGPLLADPEGFVTKKTKGLVVLPQEHGLIRKKSRQMTGAIRLNRSACEQCRMCTDLCPRHLLGHFTVPHKIIRAMAYRKEADESCTPALTCCQCNLCEYFSCPAGISPRMANTYYMGQLREKGIRHQPKAEFQVDRNREFRKVSSKRLIGRLGLSRYDRPAPLTEADIEIPVIGIGLKDHVGAPATPIVREGETVKVGQKIAEMKEGALGVSIHSSIDGVVIKAGADQIMIRRQS